MYVCSTQAHVFPDKAGSMFQQLDDKIMFHKLSLFYIGWTMVLEKAGDWNKTDQIFVLGVERYAPPSRKTPCPLMRFLLDVGLSHGQ